MFWCWTVYSCFDLSPFDVVFCLIEILFYQNKNIFLFYCRPGVNKNQLWCQNPKIKEKPIYHCQIQKPNKNLKFVHITINASFSVKM